MAITESERDAFVGAHLSPEVKEALYSMAKIRKVSVSFLVSEMIEEYLTRNSIEISKIDYSVLISEINEKVGGTE